MRQLHAYFKHPIIFNFKANLTPLRLLIGYADKKFRETVNFACDNGLACLKDDTLTFHSNNADRALKPTKRNDYIRTKTPRLTFEQIIITNYYYKQKASVKGKNYRTSNSRTSSDFDYQKRVAPHAHHSINKDITLSCRATAKLFHRNSPAYGKAKKAQIVNAGFINVYQNRVELLKSEAVALIKTGCYNIRLDKGTGKWFYVLADTFDLGNKRTKSYCEKGTHYNLDIA